MPNLTPSAVRQQIRAGTPEPIYLILGEDEVEKSGLAGEFAELVDEGLRAFNVERIHAGDMTTGDRLADGVAGIIAAVRTLPMMVPRRVAVLQAETCWRRSASEPRRALDQLEDLIGPSRRPR